MRDWIFPSIAFLIFLYGIFFVNLYVYRYMHDDNVNVFSTSSNYSNEQSDINAYIRAIAESFK